jgi:hypothetical protein
LVTGRTLTELEDGACHWPSDTQRDGQWLFACEQPRLGFGDAPDYCAFHFRLAYGKAARGIPNGKVAKRNIPIIGSDIGNITNVKLHNGDNAPSPNTAPARHSNVPSTQHLEAAE